MINILETHTARVKIVPTALIVVRAHNQLESSGSRKFANFR
jgi:uncharacterized FlgJ-related protein